MNTFVVLLRGINVGGNNLLPMRELVGILESIGCSNIKTYIQSGNVVLESSSEPSKLSKLIETEILKAKSFKANILVLSLSDFEKAIAGNPYSVEDGKLLHFYFLAEPSSAAKIIMLEKYRSTEKYELKGGVFYLYAPDGIGRSKLVPKIEKALGIPVTGRNWNTVQKLSKLAGL